MTQEDEDLRYPIGMFAAPESVSPANVAAWIDDIATLPRDLRAVVSPLGDAQLDTRYRPGGWSVRQVVHHIADSHVNSFVRFKWTLTEDRPTIKAYDEQAWAELPDTVGAPIALSLDLLDALHARWCVLLRTLGKDDFTREFVHPDSGPVPLGVNIATYRWHGRHHLAHIEQLARREGWGVS